MDLEHLRADYRQASLRSEALRSCPFDQFLSWFEQAQSAELLEPNAMTLSTVDPLGQPTTRVVLLKSFSEQGFVFYTNYSSRKALAMATNPKVAVNFNWMPLQRQVSILGTVKKLCHKQSAAYFATRPRSSQLGAWVSPQSEAVKSRAVLETLQAQMEVRFEGGAVPIPAHWGGYCIVPHSLEFWQGRTSRLHDRFIYTQASTDSHWVAQRYAP